jgi:peroxiredoxin
VLLETYIRDEPGPVELDLDDFRGGWTLLAFFPPRMATHPELAALERLRARFADEDCLVVAASIDPWRRLREAPVSFPLVSDSYALLAQAFGAYGHGDAHFGWVLLDPRGVVRASDFETEPCAVCALDVLRDLRGARRRLRLVS